MFLQYLFLFWEGSGFEGLLQDEFTVLLFVHLGNDWAGVTVATAAGEAYAFEELPSNGLCSGPLCVCVCIV